jgi:hypothetical protein
MSVDDAQVCLDPTQNGRVTSAQAEGYCKVSDCFANFLPMLTLRGPLTALAGAMPRIDGDVKCRSLGHPPVLRQVQS